MALRPGRLAAAATPPAADPRQQHPPERDVAGGDRNAAGHSAAQEFGTENTQLRVNGLYWGLDNWIYAANGRSDGDVRAPNWPMGKAVSIRRRDIRFRSGRTRTTSTSRRSPASASSAWPTMTGGTGSPPGTRCRSATSCSSSRRRATRSSPRPPLSLRFSTRPMAAGFTRSALSRLGSTARRWTTSTRAAARRFSAAMTSPSLSR